MNYFNWSEVAPNAEVIFSTLAIGEARDEIDDAVAALRLPGDLFLDVTWDHSQREYVLNVHRQSFREPAIATSRFGSMNGMLTSVKSWSENAARTAAPTPPHSSGLNESFAQET
jgi:hypothetical protein